MAEISGERSAPPAGDGRDTTTEELSQFVTHCNTKTTLCQPFDPVKWRDQLAAVLAGLPDLALRNRVTAAVDAVIRSACTVEDTLPMPKPISQVAPDFTGVPWLWRGYLGRGVYTLLLGLWKSGKTTLISHLLRAMATEGYFCGFPVKQARVLVISEESEAKWGERRDALGLGDHIHLICRPWRARPKLDEWRAFVTHIAGLVQENGYDLVIFDPISELWPVWDENDAGQVNSAMIPLHAISETGAGVLLVHHPNKSDATEGRASRGSGALTAFVDVILEFRRYDPEHESSKRTLRGYSRYDDTPSEVIVELTEDGYRLVGTRGEVERTERLDVLLEILGDAPLTVAEIWSAWPEEPRPSQRTVERDLSELVRLGQVRRLGSGTRGDPVRFRILDTRQISHGAVENRIFVLTDQDKAPELNIKAILDSSKAYMSAVENSVENLPDEQVALWDWVAPPSEWTCLGCGKPLPKGRHYYCEACVRGEHGS
jgi:hypothetical protein